MPAMANSPSFATSGAASAGTPTMPPPARIGTSPDTEAPFATTSVSDSDPSPASVDIAFSLSNVPSNATLIAPVGAASLAWRLPNATSSGFVAERSGSENSARTLASPSSGAAYLSDSIRAIVVPLTATTTGSTVDAPPSYASVPLTAIGPGSDSNAGSSAKSPKVAANRCALRMVASFSRIEPIAVTSPSCSAGTIPLSVASSDAIGPAASSAPARTSTLATSSD